MTLLHHTRTAPAMTGGWVLTLTCECGTSATYRGVVPGLTFDAADRAGWFYVPDPLHPVRPAREGICGPCQRARKVSAA